MEIQDERAEGMLTKSREESGTDPEGGRLRVTQGVAGAGLAEPHLRTSCSPFTLNGFLSHTKQTAACQLTASLSGGQPAQEGSLSSQETSAHETWLPSDSWTSHLLPTRLGRCSPHRMAPSPSPSCLLLGAEATDCHKLPRALQ